MTATPPQPAGRRGDWLDDVCFDSAGLVTVIAQDAASGRVAFSNRDDDAATFRPRERAEFDGALRHRGNGQQQQNDDSDKVHEAISS